jgi:hypothetical protein
MLPKWLQAIDIRTQKVVKGLNAKEVSFGR